MKNLVLVLSLVCSFLGQAQALSPKFQKMVKCYSNDSSFVILHKGKYESLYNVKNGSFLYGPIKSEIIYNSELDLFISIEPDLFSFIIFPSDTSAIQIYQERDNSKKDFLQMKIPDQSDSRYENLLFSKDQWINRNTSIYFDDGKNEISSDQVDFRTEISIQELNENEVIINQFKTPTVVMNNYDQMMILDSGYTLSGVYNFKLQQWSIPPDNAEIILERENLIVFNKKEMNIGEYEYSQLIKGEFTFDIYERSNQNWVKVKESVSSVNDLDLGDFLGVDSVSTIDSIYYVTLKDGKMGLVQFELGYNSFTTKSLFINTIILDPIYDLVVYNPENQKVLTFDSFSEKPITYLDIRPNSATDAGKKFEASKYLDSKLMFADLIMISTEDTFNWFNSPIHEENVHDCHFGLEKLNDSLILVTDFELGELNPLFDLETGNPITNEYGDYIYQTDSTYFRSGVFNLITKKWLVPQEHYKVQLAQNGWITTITSLENDQYRPFYRKTYEILDKDLNTVQIIDDEVDFFGDPKTLNYLVHEYDFDSVFQGSAGLANIFIDEDRSHYFISSKDLGLIIKSNQEGIYKIIGPVAFVYHNPDMGVTYKCDRTDLILEFQDSVFKVPMDHGKIELEVMVSDYEQNTYTIYLSGTDSLHFSGFSPLNYYTLRHSYRSTIEFLNDHLIISESAVMENWHSDEYGDSYFYGNYDLANSAIWKYEDDQFKKVSPYYGSITANEFGYVVQTVGGSGAIELDEEGRYLYDENGSYVYSNAIPSRYLLLDKQLKAVSFIDYYDFEAIKDLGFGLSLKTDKGYMFVNYEGQVITDDVWDSFEIENGQLKAIKFREIYDEYGYSLYDENGDIIDDPIEKIELFDLKK
ncbi:MAG: hypothetical protein R2780_10100 [Crocinitomicaceae bacterium]|nr:hypothetical protein [Crocinitomicaceae bacterium]